MRRPSGQCIVADVDDAAWFSLALISSMMVRRLSLLTHDQMPCRAMKSTRGMLAVSISAKLFSRNVMFSMRAAAASRSALAIWAGLKSTPQNEPFGLAAARRVVLNPCPHPNSQ
jgi:hypothetical protein